MSAPQGKIAFPGLTDFILSGSYALQHGIGPSICQLITTPLPNGPPDMQGDLQFSFEGNSFKFKDCKIDTIRADKNEDGFTRLMVTILDRRWKWKYAGTVSGHWNERKGEKLVGQNIPQPLIKSAKELAEICLNAMGEKNYDLGTMPKDAFPEMQWEYTNAADALAHVCEMFSHRVVLRTDDSVKLCRAGEGNQLPKRGTETQDSQEVDPPERPDNLKFVGGPDRYQYDLELECVLRDFDNGWKNIDDLSYAPPAGWGSPGCQQWNQDQINVNPRLALVNEYIANNLYRTWRIKQPFSAEIWFNGAVQMANQLGRYNICPLNATLIDTETVDKGAGKEFDPFVVVECLPLIFGLFSVGNDSGESAYHVVPGDILEQLPTGDVQRLKDPLDPQNPAQGGCAKAFYNLPYDINHETGYVQFANAVVRRWPSTPVEYGRYAYTEQMSIGTQNGVEVMGDPVTAFRVMPGRLWLRCAFNIKYDQSKGSPYLFRTKEKKIGNHPLNSGTEIVRGTDLHFKMGRYLNFGVLAGNDQEFNDAAQVYLDEAAKECDTDETAAKTWPGFLEINPDGALQQITWEVTSGGEATTRASRNKEEIFSGVSYTERRLWERTKLLLGRADDRRIL